MANRLDRTWGAPGTALLPESLRILWGQEALPPWIASEFYLPAGSTIASLSAEVWEVAGTTTLTDRQRNFVLNLVQMRRAEIRPVKVFNQPVPYWLDIKELPFSTRTRNCLVIGNLITDKEQLSNINFGRLLEVRAMGVVSILEFACMVEAAIDRASKSSAPQEVTDDELLNVLSESWIDQVGASDPRFSDLIPPVPFATVLEIIDNLTSGPNGDTAALTQLGQSLPEIKRRIKKIASETLESQLEQFFRALSGFEGERLAALLDRFGWAGSPPVTLEVSGTRLGITRERLRQLQEKVQDRLKAIAFPPYLPALDKALHALAQASPIGIEAASSLLKSSGISRISFHPESVIGAALACGRTPSIKMQSGGKKKKTIVATEITNADDVLRVAYRQAHASGASNVGEVAAEVRSLGHETTDDGVRAALRQFSDVEFLEGDWFCHRPDNPERDRLRNVSRKMLSVASPVDLAMLRDGVRREYQYRKHRGTRTWSLLVPPRSVLRAYFEVHPEFLIDENDMVKPIDPLDYRVELALNESILVDVLRSSPASVLDRASFASECERRSMNMNTFSIYLSYSPIIVHLGTDIWSLRGIRVDPAAIEAVRTANALRPREKRMLDHGWTPEGQLWMATRVPGRQTSSLVFGIPGSIKNYLAGRQFEAKDEDGVMHGTIRINDEGSSYGYGPFLRQRGADEGDILITEFDLSASRALLKLGDDDLLDEMSPEA